MAYAVPTKDAHLRVLAVEVIAGHVRTFQAYAAAHPELTFLVSRIGCGLASEGRGEEREREISTLFRGSPENVALPPGWPR
jgi:hypothetical protein